MVGRGGGACALSRLHGTLLVYLDNIIYYFVAGAGSGQGFRVERETCVGRVALFPLFLSFLKQADSHQCTKAICFAKGGWTWLVVIALYVLCGIFQQYDSALLFLFLFFWHLQYIYIHL